MITLTKLSGEDIKFILNIVGNTEIKKYFNKYPRQFSRFIKGFRADSLSEKQIQEIFIKNIEDIFIADFITGIINYSLEAISDEIKNSDYETAEERLLAALSHSPFENNPELYFKLIEQEYNEQYINLFQTLIKNKSRILDNTSETDELKSKNSELNTYLEEMRIQCQSYEKSISELNKEIDILNSRIQEKDSKLNELQSENNVLRNGTTSDYANDEEISKSSVFIIYNNYYNERKMKRIADVRNNLIIPFTADENLPYKFNNREYFNHKNGPETENYIGIWKWTAQKNWYKPESDYVTTEYVNYPYVSEVIIISECSTIDELIERLKNGLNVKYHSSCCILSIIQNDNSYRGIICNEENSSYVNGVLKLKAEEVAVDTIVFPPDNIIKLEERNVYKYISYESNIKRIPIIDIANTVKKAVLERITWAAFKAKGISRNTWKSVNDYIKELPTNDIISEIADIQHCSLNQAEEYYSKFMENADKYINGDNLELNAISYAIEHNQELSDRCKALLRDDWKNSYKSEVENVESQLAELKGAISEKRKELESIQSEKNKVQSELDAINNDIASKERLASNVEKRISEKISDAQKNAAEFISQMAFVNVGNNNRVRSNDYFTSGAAFESKSKEVYSDAKQMIELLSDNLECAGVMSQYSFPLSAYIAAAYINYFPLLIVGANANDIANAVSISLCGKTPATIDCSAEYDTGFIKMISECDDEIIVIQNPFSSNWIYAVIKALSIKNKFFILVDPFLEDLAIEPKSILNYMFPVMTDILVDKESYHDYICGSKGTDYIDLTVTDYKPANRKVFVKLSANPFFSEKAAKQLYYFHLLEDKDKTLDSDIVLSYAPVAYMSENGSILLEMMQKSSSNISSDCRKAIEMLFGESNE